MYGVRKVWKQDGPGRDRGGQVHGAASDAPYGTPGSHQRRRVPGDHHPRRDVRTPPGSRRPGLLRHGTQPAMGRRPHLCGDLVGVRLCGVRHRRVLEDDRRLHGPRRRFAPTWPATPASRPSGPVSTATPKGSSTIRTGDRSISVSVTPNGSPKPGSNHRSARSVTATTTLSPSRSSACTRPRSSDGVDPGRASTTSSTPPWSGSTDTTTVGSSNPSGTSHPPNTKPTTTVNTSPAHQAGLKQPSLR